MRMLCFTSLAVRELLAQMALPGSKVIMAQKKLIQRVTLAKLLTLEARRLQIASLITQILAEPRVPYKGKIAHNNES